jgi:hypothetical protein
VMASAGISESESGSGGRNSFIAGSDLSWPESPQR